MLTAALLLLGGVLMLLALSEQRVRPWPMSPALIYLGVGWAGAVWLGGPEVKTLTQHAASGVIVTELAVLVSLFAVGLRLLLPPTFKAWRVALLLAGPGMVVTIVLAMGAAYLLLGLPWAAALLLASVVAPTDPVLASDVQIESSEDRDAVRLSLTAEGGMNDGGALPAVMLALGLLGLHGLGPGGAQWWWADFIWPIAGGALIGSALGGLIGLALKRLLAHGDRVLRDEFIYVGVVVLSYGLARALNASSFIVAFAAGTTLLLPLRNAASESAASRLTDRLHAFGARIERLIEAALVLVVGAALASVGVGWRELGFALVLLVVVRPASVLAVVRRAHMPLAQRRLVSWFGIRGIGSLFYLVFALEHGVTGTLASTLTSATHACVALSIVLHGVSATPLMHAYKQRRSKLPAKK